MIDNKRSTRPPIDAAFQVSSIALVDDFNTRWAGWVARGRAHEQQVRRKFVVWVGALATVGAVAYAFFRS